MIGRVLRVIGRVLDGLRKTLTLVLLLVMLLVVTLALHHSVPTVPSKAALVVQLEGALVEQLTDSPLSVSMGLVNDSQEHETLLRDVIESLQLAAKDPRISVAVLDTHRLSGGGLTKLRVLAQAIADFKKSGKKVYAFGRYASQEQYYVMAQADEVYLEPSGAIELSGYAAYGLYFHDALERLGVQVNVFKVGTHKSFTEPFTRQSMSPEDREQTLGYVTPLWNTYMSGVEASRRLPPGTLAAFVSEAVPSLQAAHGDEAWLAESRHLITARKTKIEFEKQLVALVGEDQTSHSFNAISDSDYLLAAKPKARLKHHATDQIAVLVAAGTISEGERPDGEIGGDSFSELLRQARFDEDVKAVVLRIDSGGGSMMASEAIRQEVAALQASGKPVVASFSSVAASGGYYIAMNADEIWAEPTTITGSIGVFGVVPTFDKTLSKVGVSSDGVATSSLAGAMHLERSLSNETKAVLQLGVEHAYHQFVSDVAKARHKSYDEMEPLAEGRVYIGTEALRLGLVDHVGGLTQAVKAAAVRAHLEEGQYTTNWLERELSWRETLLRQLHAETLLRGVRPSLSAMSSGVLSTVVGESGQALRQLSGLNDPRHLYLYCGCERVLQRLP
jgi:protease-4